LDGIHGSRVYSFTFFKNLPARSHLAVAVSAS
jgi:hypothetical protein